MMVIWLWHLIMDFDFEIICDLFKLFVIIYLFVQLCDIFSHIDFESDLNYLFGNFNILNEA